MAEYLVQDTSLTSVADAIRSKTGASDRLAFPEGYIEAIDSIVGEGGSGLPDTIVAGDTPVLMSSTYSVLCTSSSLSATGMTITVPKAGTYRFRWYMAKLTDSGLSGTYATRLYKNGTAQGTLQSVTGDFGYKSCSLDIECAAGDEIEIYGQCRGSNYPLAVGNFVACIEWDVDWTGESGGSSGSNAFPYKVTVNVEGNLDCTPVLSYSEDGEFVTVFTKANYHSVYTETWDYTNCKKANNLINYNIGSFAVFYGFTGDATITVTFTENSGDY